jgi:hypothetical protein
MLTFYKITFFIILTLSGIIVTKQVKAEMFETTETKLLCELSARPTQVLSEGIWVTFSIQSSLDETIQILPWHTPLEGIFSHFFTIKDISGHQLSYQGPLMKRAAPIRTDYISLKAKETLSNSVSLSNVYSFKQQQSYIISLKDFKIKTLTKEGNQQSVNCDSNLLSIKVI